MKYIITDKIDENLYNHYDYIFLFNNRLTSSSKKIYSLVSLLESEEYIKKKDLNKLINNFSYNTINENSYLFRKNQAFNFILNFIFTEKNIFMTNFYFKFYQYIVFEKVKKKLTLGNNFEIRLEDKDLISFFKCETKTPNKLFRIKFFFNFFKGIISHSLDNFLFIFNNHQLKFEKNNKFLFVDHFSNFYFENKNYQSKLWNKLINSLHLNNIRFLAVNNNTRKIKRDLESIQNYNKYSIFFKTIKSFIVLFFKIIFYLENKNNNEITNNILFNFFLQISTGPVLIKSINDYYLFLNYFSKNKFEKIFIPHENQCWEKLILHACGYFNKNTKFIFYIHTPIRYWDLRYDFTTFNEMSFNSIPDYICVSSYDCLDQYKYVKNTELFLVEALRYGHLQYLNRISSNKKLKNKKNNFVIIGDILYKSTFNLINLINEFSFQKNIKLTVYVKFHPFNDIDISRFKNLNIIKINNANKFTNNIFLFPNYTTSLIDFYNQNYLCLSYLDKINFNLSPLFKNKSYNFYFDDINSFINKLDKVKNRDSNENTITFYFTKTYKNWLKVINV